MLNVLQLADVAHHIANYFSWDAGQWPIDPALDGAVAIRWSSGDQDGEVSRLIEALKLCTAAPFRSDDRPDSAAIVTERSEQVAQAVVTFWRQDRPDDGPGVRYELKFTAAGEVWPGWFALRAA